MISFANSNLYAIDDVIGILEYLEDKKSKDPILKEKLEIRLEVISKPHLRPGSCVASLFKMLTTSHGSCAFSSACALLSDLT